MLSLGSGMRLRSLVFIMLLAPCHSLMSGQAITVGLPPARTAVSSAADVPGGSTQTFDLPNAPEQELFPVAVPEPNAPTGTPVHWEADRQSRSGDDWTLAGRVVLFYGDYVLRADRIVYHPSTTLVEAEGHLQLKGGAEDILLNAERGDMCLKAHTGHFYTINGSLGMRNASHSKVYTSPDPFLFRGRELVEKGPGSYQVIDGAMTNCPLPKPDWLLLSHSIELQDGRASAKNIRFQLFGVPLLYLPFLRHSAAGDPRQSGFLIPVFSYSTIKGLTLGEQIYVVLGRSADLTIGTEYYSQRGFSPNGDFRFRGSDLNVFNARWNALLDRRIGPATSSMGNQGGIDILAEGRRDFSPDTRLAGTAEFLSKYLYRLVFNSNYTQATDSTVRSEVAYTTHHDGFVVSANAARFQSFSGISSNNEIRILHLPGIHADVVEEPLGSSPFYGEMSASVDHITRAQNGFHAYNDGRFDVHPQLSLPWVHDGWSVVPSAGLRLTGYSNSQTPDLANQNAGNPTINHESLLRRDAEFSLDLRPPAIERDFRTAGRGYELRHVIESELSYHFVGGIGQQAQRVLLADSNDIATDTNEAGFSVTQRLYVRSLSPCKEGDSPCNAPRQWASWQIAQRYFFDPQFGGAVSSGVRTITDSSLDFTGTTFLLGARSSSPILSRMRFEAIRNLRLEWDMDYDMRVGRLATSNLFAGYTKGRTTFGLGHSLLNALGEQNPKGSFAQLAEAIQYQQLQPFLAVGKPTDSGFSLAANGGYDLNHGSLQYGGIQAVYNRGCCGIMVGYRHFALGTVREEDQYLYGFTLAGFGTAGDIRRSNSVFRDPKLPPLF